MTVNRIRKYLDPDPAPRQDDRAACSDCGVVPGAIMTEREREMLRERGWYVHLVGDSEGTTEWINAHTHGLPEKLGHDDFQIVMPIPGGLVMTIMGNAVRAVQLGKVFAPGDHDDILGDYSVRIVEAEEEGRRVLRIMLPDCSGRLPGDAGCAPKFAQQEEIDP